MWLRQSKLWTRTEIYSLHLTGQEYCTASSSVGRRGPLSWTFRHMDAEMQRHSWSLSLKLLHWAAVTSTTSKSFPLTPPRVSEVREDSWQHLGITVGHRDWCLKFGNTISKTHYCSCEDLHGLLKIHRRDLTEAWLHFPAPRCEANLLL